MEAALDEIRRMVASTAAEAHIPAISWGILVDGVLAHTGSVGSVAGSPPSPTTVFRIASMTKSFTAAAVLALRDSGALSLDDPLARHAPECAALAPAAQPMRLRHLLSMGSGLGTDDPWADRRMGDSDAALDAALAQGALRVGAPGEVYEYSNLGYGLLGRAVARATGASVQELVTAALLRPLGLGHTSWDPPPGDDWARPHRVEDGVAVPEGTPLQADGAVAPMGGLWSCVADVAAWAAWHQAAWAEGDAPASPLAAASRREQASMQRYIGNREPGGGGRPLWACCPFRGAG